MEGFLWYYLFLVFISVFAVASVFWFFKKRRELIIFIRDTTRELESYYKPSSKEYVLLGYLVGYRARYILPGKHRVYILLTTAPRHILLYMPVVLLFKRRDRLEIAYSPSDRYVTSEIHVHKTGSWTAEVVIKKNIVNRLHEFHTKELSISGREYLVYYKDERVLDSITSLLNRTDLPILYLYTLPRENIISACCEVTLDNLRDFLDLHKKLVEATTKPKTR